MLVTTQCNLNDSTDVAWGPAQAEVVRVTPCHPHRPRCRADVVQALLSKDLDSASNDMARSLCVATLLVLLLTQLVLLGPEFAVKRDTVCPGSVNGFTARYVMGA